MRRVLLIPAIAWLGIGCGADEPTTEAAVAASTPVEAPVAIPAESPAESRAEPLLVDALPGFSGPTVLWFWAPG